MRDCGQAWIAEDLPLAGNSLYHQRMGTNEANQAAGSSLIRAYWPVVLMLLIFLIMLGFQGPIRARWWEYRLRESSTDVQRLHYFNLLVSAGDTSLPAARSLLSSSEPSLRIFGVSILHVMEGEGTSDLLASATEDSDAGVREMALIGLAMRRDTNILEELQKMTAGDNPAAALTAIAAYGFYECSESGKALVKMMRTHPNPLVRAQAVEQIGASGCKDAIPFLIEALDDLAGYEGMTNLQQMDQVAAGMLGSKLFLPQEQFYQVTGGSTVADQAALVLRMMTGQSFGFVSSNDSTLRDAAQMAWQNWWKSKQVG